MLVKYMYLILTNRDKNVMTNTTTTPRSTISAKVFIENCANVHWLPLFLKFTKFYRIILDKPYNDAESTNVIINYSEGDPSFPTADDISICVNEIYTDNKIYLPKNIDAQEFLSLLSCMENNELLISSSAILFSGNEPRIVLYT